MLIKISVSPKCDDFQSLFEESKGRAVVTHDRCFMLYQFAKYAEGKPGEMAELGVYKGGTARLLANTCPNKPLHLFDTFAGLPEEDPSVLCRCKGEFTDTSLEAVREYLEDCQNVVFHPGYFPDTADVVRDKLFSFVYMDGDLYQSTLDCFEFFYDRMVVGGVIVLDDYDWKDCPGVKEAACEFLADKPENLIIAARYQGLLIKL